MTMNSLQQYATMAHFIAKLEAENTSFKKPSRIIKWPEFEHRFDLFLRKQYGWTLADWKNAL